MTPEQLATSERLGYHAMQQAAAIVSRELPAGTVLAGAIIIHPADPSDPAKGGQVQLAINGALYRDHVEVLIQGLPELLAQAWEQTEPLQ